MKISLPNNWKPRAYQMPAWEYLENGGKHAQLYWHRRSGKDELSLHRTACGAFERVGNYWHCLPKQVQARKAIWQAINPHTGKRRIDEAFPPELRSGLNDNEMRLPMRNGSSWQVVGSDNFNTLVGSPPIGVVFSEWPLCDPSSWAYLRPIFAENNGWVIFNGTPRGRNHAYRMLQSSKKEEGHFTQVLAAEQTGVFSEKTLTSEKRQLVAEYGEDFGQSIYAQEYECSFEAANIGAVLGRWLSRARTEGRICSGVYDPDGGPVWISCDLGRRDTCAWWFWQPRMDGFGVIGYVAGSGIDADEWIDRLSKIIKDKGYKLGGIWMPHDARHKTFAAKHSAQELFSMHFGWDRISIVPITSIDSRVNAGRQIIESCHFDEVACEDGIDGLASWHYGYDEEARVFTKEPEHDWASHPGDAFTYGAQMLNVLPKPEVKKEPQYPLQIGGHLPTVDEIIKRAVRKRAEMEA